jgi:hypothetical protein
MVNLRVAAGGAAARYLQKEDEREAFIRELSMKNRQYLLETGAQKLQDLRDRRDAKLSKIGAATSLGFTEEAAILLDASGQLDKQISELSKLSDDKINKDNIKMISELVVNKVNPEYRAQVLESFLTSTNFDVSEIQERFGNAIFNAAEGSVEKASKILSEAPSGSSMSIDNFDISFRPTRPMTTEDLNTANKAIDNIIQANFGNLYTGDGETYQGEDAPEVGRIRNEMMEVYKNTWDTATYTGNPIDILYSLGDSIYQQTRGGKVRPTAKVVVTTNWQDLPDYTQPPTGGSSNTADATEGLTEEGNNPLTPPSAEGFYD